MAKAKTKAPHQPATKITLSPKVVQTLLTLEREKQELHAQGAAKEREQIALLTGIVAGTGAGEFDPLEWDLSNIGQGYITRIIDVKGKPVEVGATKKDIEGALKEHAEKKDQGEPTPMRRRA